MMLRLCLCRLFITSSVLLSPLLPVVTLDEKLYSEFFEAAVAGGDVDNPGAVLTVNQPGVEYAFDLAGKVLNNEIMNLNVTDIYEKFDDGYIGVSNLNIIAYNPPKFVRNLQPPDRLTWSMRGAGVQVQGKWRGSKKVVVQISGDGTFKARARKLDIAVDIVVGNTSDGRPTITDVRCKSDLGSIDLHITGGLTGWVLNVFRKLLVHSVQPILENKICEIARDFVRREINTELATFPPKVRVLQQQGVDLYLALFDSPRFTSDAVITSHSCRVESSASNSTPFVPRDLNFFSNRPVADKMVSLRVSDYVVNALLYHIYLSDVFRIEIDPGQFGRVSCSIMQGEICMGSIFGDLAKLYPPTSTVRIVMKAVSVPVAFFVQNKTVLHGVGEITLKVLDSASVDSANNDSSTLDENAYLKIRINLTAEIKEAYIANSTLYSRLNLSGFDLILMDDQGKIATDLWSAFIAFVKPLLRNVLRNVFQMGWPLKLIDGVAFYDGRVEFFNRTMLIEADIDYYHEMKPGYIHPDSAHRYFGAHVHCLYTFCIIVLLICKRA